MIKQKCVHNIASFSKRSNRISKEQTLRIAKIPFFVPFSWSWFRRQIKFYTHRWWEEVNAPIWRFNFHFSNDCLNPWALFNHHRHVCLTMSLRQSISFWEPLSVPLSPVHGHHRGLGADIKARRVYPLECFVCWPRPWLTRGGISNILQQGDYEPGWREGLGKNMHLFRLWICLHGFHPIDLEQHGLVNDSV